MQNKKHTVLFLGPDNAGKSSLFNILSCKEPFSLEKKTYLTTRMMPKRYDGADVTANYTDIGSSVDLTVTQKIVQSVSTKIVCLVFDANNEHWITEINQFLDTGIELSNHTSVLLIGNKIDTIDEEKQLSLQSSAAKYMARHYGAKGHYIAVSAKTALNIEGLTTKIVDTLSNDTFALNTTQAAARGFKKRRSATDLEARIEEEEDDLSSVGESSNGGYGSYHGGASVSDLGAPTYRSLSNSRSFTNNRQYSMQATEQYKPRFGDGREALPVGAPVSQYKLLGLKTPSPSPNKARTPVRSVGRPPIVRGIQPPTDSYFALALRLAGMALIIAALTSLIYLAIVAAGWLSSVALTATVNQIVTTVGGLVGMSLPVVAFGNLCAAWGLSTVTGSGLVAATASLVTIGLGFGLRHLGRRPTPAANAEDLTVAPATLLSSALRLIGMVLMLAALVNLIYLILIAAHVFSTVALTAGMNQFLVTVGGVLGVTAPVAAFANASAAIGLSATSATGALSATGSVLVGSIGYSLFRRSAPQPRELSGPLDDADTRDRAYPL